MSRRPAAKTALRIVEPTISQEVYAVNDPIGKVYQVVISPRSRRVSAVIVRGKLPDSQPAKLRQLADMWPQQERTVVIPARERGFYDHGRLPDSEDAGMYAAT